MSWTGRFVPVLQPRIKRRWLVQDVIWFGLKIKETVVWIHFQTTQN